MVEIAQERAEDWFEVEALFDLTFVPGRTALSSYRLRDDVEPLAELCLVARDELKVLAGAVRHWPVLIGATWPCLLLGPIAVHPTRQGEGLGALLMEEAVARATALGWQRILLIGDEPYYRRFGFEQMAGRGITFPPPTNPERILGRALVAHAFDEASGLVAKWPSAMRPENTLD